MQIYFSHGAAPNADQGLLILEVSRSHKRRTTVGKTSLDELSARPIELYLTTQY